MAFSDFTKSYILFAVLHFLQFVMAIAVCGLYGQDLHAAQVQGKYMDGKWVLAVVVGGLSALTALVYTVPSVMRCAFTWIWGFILTILWIAVFGVFGQVRVLVS
jgi:hypothetical protein